MLRYRHVQRASLLRSSGRLVAHYGVRYFQAIIEQRSKLREVLGAVIVRCSGDWNCAGR